MIERKPRDDFKDEYLLKCFKCKQWLPSGHYGHGLAGPHPEIFTLQEYIDNGHIWACDKCFLESGLFAVPSY